jgi:outer membrane protein insertion porin family
MLKYPLVLAAALCLFVPAVLGQVSLGGDLEEIDYANPREFEIAGITVSGAGHLNQSVLVMLSGLSIGDRIMIPGDKISEAIQNLWEQGLFEDIRITVTRTQDKLIFLDIFLQEKPRMTSFSFEGVKKTEADDIRDLIRIASGDVVTDNLIIRTRNTIKDHFRDKGYLDAGVDIVQKPDTANPNQVSLLIRVKKNDRIRINQINIIGNSNLSDQKLKRTFKETKERGIFAPLRDLAPLTWDVVSSVAKLKFSRLPTLASDYLQSHIRLRIFKGSKFIENDYTDDKVKLVARYNEFGYRDAKIISDSVYRHDKRSIDIDIMVTEGPKYYFRNITWVGNTKYSSAELTAILRIRKGDVYNYEALSANLFFNQTEDDVSSLYMNDGYLFFSAEPVEVQIENDSIDLEVRIHEGQQATIRKVTVKGNTRTNDHVIMREIRTRPGQLFSRSDIIRTTRELAQLRYFDQEKIKPNVNPNPVDGTVDIEYEVEETSSDQLELSGGWGYGRVIGTLGVSFNNFSARNLFKKEGWAPVPIGDGQRLSVRLSSYGQGYIGFTTSFMEPWLGGKKPNAFSVSYYHSKFSYEDSEDTAKHFFTINGLQFGLAKRLLWPDDYFQLSQAIDLQHYNLHNYTSIFSFSSGTGQFYNFSYNIGISRQSIDFPIYPRSGSAVELSLKMTPPYSLFSEKNYKTMAEDDKYRWIEYHKWKFNTSWFTRISGNLVLMTRAKFGFLGYYNSDIGMTPFERFFLGGDGLSGFNAYDGRDVIGMRGYGNETITPDYYKTTNVGGTIYNKYTMELRYPLSLNPNATIYGMGFIEAGNAWLNFEKMNPFDVKRSAGVGVRVFLPMFGVLGLDWGYGFDDIPGLPEANKGQFHFSINQSID